jgi:hypothetical protein
MFKNKVALLLAMMLIMVSSSVFGSTAAYASSNDTATSASETIAPVCVSDTVDGVIYKNFDFSYEDHAYTWDIQVPASLVTWDRSVLNTLSSFYSNGGANQGTILKNANSKVLSLIQTTYPSNNGDDTAWVDEPQNNAYVQQLAQALLAQGQLDNFSKFQDAGLALSFVQSIPYVPNQFPRLAAQTLVDNGDCDDRSILLVGLLKDMGINSDLQMYTAQNMGLSFGHMNVGIEVGVPDGYSYNGYTEDAGNCYYVAETTNRTPIGYTFTEKPSYAYPVV